MLKLNKQNKARYQVDLAALQAVCSANYLGMHRLFPALRSEALRDILLDCGGVLRLEVIERGPYTTLVRMQAEDGVAGLRPGEYQVMVYHDVRMAEVIGVGGRRKLRGRYPYPNRQMHQQDEKWQMNSFLGEWIRHCLDRGRTEWRGRAGGQPGCENRQWLEL